MMPSSATDRSFPNESRKDKKNIVLKPAVEEVNVLPKGYEWNADDESAKTDTLKGELKRDTYSEFGNSPTSRDISRKYNPAPVARKKDEYTPGLSFLTTSGGGVCPEIKFCKTR